ncbi:MAG TPA: serine/threonine-protein kinase [Gemmatimonadaceae bacterium]|nr:serine/threonine-protein kinase [Gemmatimonadaceae bacterium]
MTASLHAQLQKTLGDSYAIERELGGGGMSRVFEAEELRLKRKVAIKVLSPELAQGLSISRFEREIQTAAALQQANIVPVLTAGDIEGLPFYTMPFVDGESLRARVGRGSLSVSEVVSVLKDVAKALAYAHARGVVHRDIKPDNVLLSGGTAVVTDFGIAKAISAARTGGPGATLTQIGTSIGTPAYMAPEQAAGDPDVDHRADLYALGAMAYELLAGRPVFADRTPQRMLAAHMSEAPQSIAELRPDVPASLTTLVMQCLSKDPNARPQTASEVLRVLDTVTASGANSAMPPVLLGGTGMFKKALAIYAAAFIIVAIVAKAAIMGIGLPDWVFPGSLVVMALGLPVILWTGYVQRVTRRALASTPTYTPGGTPSLLQGTMATIALKASPHVSWYRTARGGLYALGAFIAVIAAFMALRASGVGPFGSLLAKGALSRSDRILIADFHTTNVDSTLGRVVSDAVRAGLAGSSAFRLVQPAEIVSALRLMQRAPDTRVDLTVARDIAQRQGIKAIVDGDVTGVPGGYIVSIRLVRADSGSELASLRETGDGPRGLIDAADKLARALRGKAGESLRAVNATPPLNQVTTGSLDALRKASEGTRANTLGDPRSIDLLRQAVAIDSTFASGWRMLANVLSNYGGTQSAIDSASTQAYRYRDRLPPHEHDMVVADFYTGPGRDRDKAIAAYEGALQRGDSLGGLLINLGEVLRSRREFARAESLNIATARLSPGGGIALANAVELEIDQGKLAEAMASVARLDTVAPLYGAQRRTFLAAARGDDQRLRALIDSTLKAGGDARKRVGVPAARALALREGRTREYAALTREDLASGNLGSGPDVSIRLIALEIGVHGPTPALVQALDTAIAHVPFATLPLIDRPYLAAATALARAGNAIQAQAMIARYRAEMTDTSIRRIQEPTLHGALAEIALAGGKPRDALAEFRRADVAWDSAPADECAPCLPFNLGRAYDAAGQADSAAMFFERYTATPYWLKASAEFDPVRLPAIRERLGQLYESMGKLDKAMEQYRAFIELWKNADPELQPRVAEARRRMERLQAQLSRKG